VARIKGRGSAARRTRDRQAYRNAAIAELADARPLRDNGFKVELATRTLIAVLSNLAGAAA
jgi:xanthine dehydrogenase YagS FAD-binding subunit